MIIKNNDKVLNYVGEFETFMKENETVISSNTKGSYVEFKFTGKGFKYYAHTNAWRGISVISIDNITDKEIDLYSKDEKNNVLVYEKNNLEFKEHVVKIEVKGIKRTESKDTKVTFMYFDIDDVDENKDDSLLFNDVAELKTANLKIGDIVATKGYYSAGDGGEAKYIIQDYNYYLNEWLPFDCRKIGNEYNRLGTDRVLYNSPVDEFGNHTLDNGLVACLLDKENVKPEQYGAKAENNYNNLYHFQYLFAHMKHGKIIFKSNVTYYLGEPTSNDYPTGMKHHQVPYGVYMGGRGCNCIYPTMSNIDGVELIGNNTTLKIMDNRWNSKGYGNDFALLNLFRVIRNLTIHGIKFHNNGLTMDDSHSVENHGISWKQGNLTSCNGFGTLPTVEDGTIHEISNVEIYNCEFIEGGTRKNVQDVGGDGILIINPMGNSHDINIHDNKFINWGRWCLAIDLGGNGECIENVKFNGNYCFQDATKNTSLYGGCRGLGWIDFEARKCFKNLEVCNNYIDGWHGFAFNGAGKVSENITIKNNIMVNTTTNTVGGKGYPYTYNFYGVQPKNLVFENNVLTPGPFRFGYTIYNATIRNNKFPSTTDAFSINGAIGSIVIEGNEREDYGKICSIGIGGELPNYLTEEEKENIEVNFIFNNNKGGLIGGIVNKEKRGYKKVTLEIKGNEMSGIDFIVNNSQLDNVFSFDVSQIINIDTLYAFGCRGAKFNGLTTLNYRGIPNGGGYYKVGDIIAETNNKKLVCNKEGYLYCQGNFKLCESDLVVSSISKTSELGIARRFVLTDDSVYYVTKKGNINGQDFPSHKEGEANWGEATLLYICERGSYEKINK